MIIYSYFSPYSDLKGYPLRHQIQGEMSLLCGTYVFYFAFHLCNMFEIRDLVGRFSQNNRLKNDKIVELVICRYKKQVRLFTLTYGYINA